MALMLAIFWTVIDDRFTLEYFRNAMQVSFLEAEALWSFSKGLNEGGSRQAFYQID